MKFFVMKLFMERHSIPRMFFIDSDVMLFANVTELAAMHFQNVPLALGYRFPRWVCHSGFCCSYVLAADH